MNRAESFHGRLTEMIREEFGYHHDESFKKEAWDRWHEILGDTHSFMKTQFDRHAEVLQ